MTRLFLKRLAALLVVATAVTTAGFLDHSHKVAQMQRANTAWWFCEHRHVGCGSNPEAVEHRADHIERGWKQRERVYTVLLGAVAGAAFALIAWNRPRSVARKDAQLAERPAQSHRSGSWRGADRTA